MQNFTPKYAGGVDASLTSDRRAPALVKYSSVFWIAASTALTCLAILSS